MVIENQNQVSILKTLKSFQQQLNDLQNNLLLQKQYSVEQQAKQEEQVINSQISKIINKKQAPNIHKTPSEKREIALYALDCSSNVQAAKKYDLSEKSVRRYKETCLTEEDYNKNQFTKKQKKYKPHFPEMELQLFQWIQNQREQKLLVGMRDIQKKALEFTENKQFKASNGWFDRFITRYKLSRRTPTHVVSALGENIVLQIEMYLKEIISFRFQKHREGKQILFINLDEAPIQFNFKKKTYGSTGKKQINSIRIKNPKQRIACLLTTVCNINIWNSKIQQLSIVRV